jgi:hypothetical protein
MIQSTFKILKEECIAILIILTKCLDMTDQVSFEQLEKRKTSSHMLEKMKHYEVGRFEPKCKNPKTQWKTKIKKEIPQRVDSDSSAETFYNLGCVYTKFSTISMKTSQMTFHADCRMNQ